MDFEYKDVEYEGRNVRVPIPPYRYLSFAQGKREFRLLKILPAEDHEVPMICRLEHYSMDDPPFYTALSYQWGDPSQWRVIDVDGTRYPVGLNLDSALRQLRARKCPLLWIDAICINQQDKNEKSAHIPLMKGIYHQADCVSVWLGPESDGSERVMQMLRAVDISRRPGQAQDKGPWTPDSQLLQRHKAELRAFLQRSFWRRVWIIQEIASGSHVTVFCGPMVADWRGLEILLPFLEREPESNATDLEYIKHLNSSRTFRIEGKPVGLLQALYNSRTAQATDNRDKVFALLGLTFDVIWAKKSLDIIFAAAPSMKPQNLLPSWIPDYLYFGRSGHPHILAGLSHYISREDERYRTGHLGRRWNATGNSVVTRDAVQIIQNQLLRVQGFCFGTVNGLGAVLGDNRPPQYSTSSTNRIGKTDTQFVEDLCAAFTLYDKEYEKHQSKPRMARFVFQFENSQKYYFNKARELSKRFLTVHQWRERNKDFMIRGKELRHRTYTLETWGKAVDGWQLARVGLLCAAPPSSGLNELPKARKLMSTGAPPADMVAALENLQDLINEGLRLMTTEEDHIGWAHPAAQIGDQLFLLKGCSMPAILRPSQDSRGNYTVVGHAYVQGVMNNEVWSKLGRDQLQEVALS